MSDKWFCTVNAHQKFQFLRLSHAACGGIEHDESMLARAMVGGVGVNLHGCKFWPSSVVTLAIGVTWKVCKFYAINTLSCVNTCDERESSQHILGCAMAVSNPTFLLKKTIQY